MEEVIAKRIAEHQAALAEFERGEGAKVVAEVARLLVNTIRKGNRIYLAGNGGSAADAQHIAGEIVGRFLLERSAWPATALSTDTSVLSCVANDYDWREVFARQVEAFVQAGDVYWGLSTSGNSANVVAGAELARDRGAKVIAFTGPTGGKLKGIANLCLLAPGPATAHIQEIHQVAYHIICELVEADLTGREEVL